MGVLENHPESHDDLKHHLFYCCRASLRFLHSQQPKRPLHKTRTRCNNVQVLLIAVTIDRPAPPIKRFGRDEMSATEIVSLFISVTALILSMLSLMLLYSVRDDLKFKITEPQFVSLEPINENPRTVAISFNAVIYNLGNRSAALEHLSLGLIKGSYSPTACEASFDSLVVPIAKSTYAQLTVQSVIIQKESIYSEEFVFDLFFFNRKADIVEAEGLLCLKAGFSNSRGEEKSISVPIAIIKIRLERSDQNINVNMNTDPFKHLRNLNVF